MDILFYYLLNILDVGLGYMLFQNYFERKEKMTFMRSLLVITVLAVSSNWIKSYVNTAAFNFFVTAISLLLLCLICFKGSIKLKLLCSSFFMFLVLFLDFIVGLLLTMYLKIDVGNILEEENLRTLAFFIFLFFKFLVIQLIIRKRKYYFIGAGRLYLIQMIIPVISGISLHYLLYLEISMGEHLLIRIYVMMFVLSVINIVQYYVFEQLNKLQNERIESIRIQEIYKYKEDHYREVEKHQHEIRTIKHDLKNQLIALKAFLSKKNYQQAELEIDTILQDVLSIEEYYFTGNQVVNALLNAKVKLSREWNIRYDISANLPEHLHISERDFVILLGNLLDNCIEACSKVDDGEFHLKIFYNNGAIIIQSDNTTDGNVKDMNTRKENKIEHGYGLKSMQAIVSKYQGNMKIKNEENKFYYNIILWDVS